MNNFKINDKVIWFNEKAVIISKEVTLAYNNGIGYKIKLLSGKRLYVIKEQLKYDNEVLKWLNWLSSIKKEQENLSVIAGIIL